MVCSLDQEICGPNGELGIHRDIQIIRCRLSRTLSMKTALGCLASFKQVLQICGDSHYLVLEKARDLSRKDELMNSRKTSSLISLSVNKKVVGLH